MMDRRELERTVRTFYRARNDNDIEQIMALVDPNACFRIAGNYRLGPLTHMTEGTSEISARFGDLMTNWDVSGLDIESMHVDGDTVLVHRSGSIRFIPTDTFIDTEMLDKLTFSDGRIIEFVEFVDTLMAAEMIGFVKPSGIWTGVPGLPLEPRAAKDPGSRPRA
jgi:ketosteroid isomerase-like protein